MRRDVAQQLGRLVFPGFITPTGADRLPDVERYLRGAVWRLERLTRNAAVDRDRMRAINELEDALPRTAALPAGALDGELARCRGCSRSCGSASSRRRSGPKGQVDGAADPPHPRRSRP